MMKRFLLTIQYDGTNYHGWQVQKNAITVQQVLQDAIESVFKERLDVKGCSRTDSGVHANMYCVSFDSDMNIAPSSVIASLNGFLPKDIVVKNCENVSLDFHPRYSVKSKEYLYVVNNADIRDAFNANYSYYYHKKIDADYLDKEAKAFIGTHDYKGFCSVKSGVEDTVRNVYSFDVWRDGDMVYFKVSADGFLYNMVRIMIGTLLFINDGKIKKGELADVISSCDRKRAGKTAPPQGLYLNKVNY